VNALARGGVSSGLDLLERLRVPDAISAVFQPILWVSGGELRVHSVEGLTRGPRGTELESAGRLFEHVREWGIEASVDRLCTAAVLAAAARLPQWLPLSLNVHASTLSRDTDFGEILVERAAAAGIAPTRVTLEVVESTAPQDGERFARALAALRGRGFQFAVDDVGLGHSNLKMFVDVRPEYFKLDRYFVDGIETDPYRQAVLKCMGELARTVGASVVAEGVESDASLRAVIGAQISLVQGNLFAQPLPIEKLLDHPFLLRAPS
jgi:EAL domain-containing protein (putative c-di-GMP-specific phosphodiesterase class I)